MKANKQCPICKKDIKNLQSQYCKNHSKAKEELKKGYEAWLKAYGSFSWDDFLQKILDLEGLAGDFVREIAQHEFYFSNE